MRGKDRLKKYALCATAAGADLAQEVERAGYYPELVLDTLSLSLADEAVEISLVQTETTFAEGLHRHLTVLALTASRLIVVHVDDAPHEYFKPEALATCEAVPIAAIRSVALTRGVHEPANKGGTLTEMTLAICWGSVRRIDLERATCGDPDCQADHGLSGHSTPDDIALRVAAGVEGDAALERAEAFAHVLSKATARLARRP